MKHWLIGTAAAFLTSTALAAQGHGNGGGHGGGGGGGHGNGGGQGHGAAMHGPSMHGPSMHGPAMHGPSMHGPSMHGPSMHGPAMHGPAMKERGNPGRGHAARSEAPAMKPAAHHSNGQPENRGQAARSRVKGNGGRDRALAVDEQQARPSDNGKAPGHPQAMKPLHGSGRVYTRPQDRPVFNFASARRGLIQGCPPGLAMKGNGCLPPGQARPRAYQSAWWGMGGLAGGPYYYNDGYLLRLNGNTVAGYIPLLGGALSVGNVWPRNYAPLPVPQYYVDYYDLGPVGSYRYANDVFYRVDPATAAITAIAALVTGDDIRIGSPMPPGYGVYNVPYRYRGQYADGPDARYRYSDGYVYRIDPTTQLVTAAIELLAS